jgi:hypothetical protein
LNSVVGVMKSRIIIIVITCLAIGFKTNKFQKINEKSHAYH